MPYTPFTPPPLDRQINPTWRCFCCHDTGIVVNVRALPGGEHYKNTDPSVVCKRRDCDAFRKKYVNDNGLCNVLDDLAVSTCATYDECEMLHQMEKDDWIVTIKNQYPDREFSTNGIGQWVSTD